MSSNSSQQHIPSVSQLTNYEDALSTQSSYKTCLDTIPSSTQTSTVSTIIIEATQDAEQISQEQELLNTTGANETQPTHLYPELSTQQLMDQPSYSPLCSHDNNVSNTDLPTASEQLEPREALVFPTDSDLHVPIDSQPIVPQNTPNPSQD